MGYVILAPIPERYDAIEGMEGPFRMGPNYRIVYYCPKEGKYYDRDKDMFLTDDEADWLTRKD